jgi:hypothetical protein
MAKKPKTYDGPGKEFQDEKSSKKIKEREAIASKMVEWKGDEDVEAICKNFIEFLWSGSLTTLKVLQKERLLTKLQLQEEAEERRRAIER